MREGKAGTQTRVLLLSHMGASPPSSAAPGPLREQVCVNHTRRVSWPRTLLVALPELSTHSLGVS